MKTPQSILFCVCIIALLLTSGECRESDPANQKSAGGNLPVEMLKIAQHVLKSSPSTQKMLAELLSAAVGGFPQAGQASDNAESLDIKDSDSDNTAASHDLNSSMKNVMQNLFSGNNMKDPNALLGMLDIFGSLGAGAASKKGNGKAVEDPLALLQKMMSGIESKSQMPSGGKHAKPETATGPAKKMSEYLPNDNSENSIDGKNQDAKNDMEDYSAIFDTLMSLNKNTSCSQKVAMVDHLKKMINSGDAPLTPQVKKFLQYMDEVVQSCPAQHDSIAEQMS